MAVVTISYPDKNNVPGGGGFHAWGTTDGKCVSVDAFVATGVGNFPGIEVPAPVPCQWSFRFEGLPIGVPGTLTVRCLDQFGNPISNADIPVTCVPPPP